MHNICLFDNNTLTTYVLNDAKETQGGVQSGLSRNETFELAEKIFQVLKCLHLNVVLLRSKWQNGFISSYDDKFNTIFAKIVITDNRKYLKQVYVGSYRFKT